MFENWRQRREQRREEAAWKKQGGFEMLVYSSPEERDPRVALQEVEAELSRSDEEIVAIESIEDEGIVTRTETTETYPGDAWYNSYETHTWNSRAFKVGGKKRKKAENRGE